MSLCHKMKKSFLWTSLKNRLKFDLTAEVVLCIKSKLIRRKLHQFNLNQNTMFRTLLVDDNFNIPIEFPPSPIRFMYKCRICAYDF